MIHTLRHAASPETLLAAALLLALWAPVHAQPRPDPQKPLSHLSLDTWYVADGLPQNTVTALIQTRDGYLWVGSQEGLARYNGHTFHLFDEDNTRAFEPSETIRTLLEGRNGVLWIGTRQGVSRIAPAQTAAEHRVERYAPDVLGALDVLALADASDGTLWVGTSDGLFRCRAEACAPTTDDALRQTRVHALLTDGPALWAGTEHGLVWWNGTTTTQIGSEDGLPSDEVLALTSGSGGTLWVGTRSGLARVHTHGLATPIVEPLPDVAKEPVWVIMEDGGTLWVGLDRGGLVRYHEGRVDTLRPIDGGLPSGRVQALLLDGEGSLWVGVENGGLVRLRDSPFSTLTTADGLSDNMAVTVYGDGTGQLWAGTYDGALHRVQMQNERFYTEVERRFEHTVSSLARLGASLWVGTFGGGLHRRTVEGWRTLTTTDGLPSDGVYALHTGPSGTLWIGTDGGLARWSGGRLTTYTVEHGLSSNVITTILETRDGAVWVGTYDGGLNRMRGGTIKTIRADVLGSDVISALYEDADGTLWIGTYGGGLVRHIDGTYVRFTPRHGLYDDKLYQILEDGSGGLWMGCNKGIFRVAKDDLHAVADGNRERVASTVYDEDDGLRNREVNGGVQPAGWRDRDGRLWFPTVAGLAFVDPDAPRRNATPPPVVIEQVRVERETVALPAEGALTVPPGTEHLDVIFAALSLADPEAVRYRYRLDGFEETWSEPTDRRVASYTHLNPGRYTFRVTAMNADGVWNEQGAAVQFDLRPFLWQTPWFWLLVGLTAVGAGAGAYRMRVRHLTRRQVELESEVDARTHDLQTALDEKEVLLREIHHRVKNNLQVVSSLLHLQGQKSGDDATRALFGEARGRVHAMAMLHERLYRSDNLARLDFGGYLHSVIEQLFHSYRVRDDVTLDVRADDVYLDPEQAIPLGLIASELVSNALKHALSRDLDRPGSRLLVTFDATPEDYRLAVEDDGPGLPEVFTATGPPGPGRSLGLKLAHAFAAKLGGTLTAGPAEHAARGARFVLTFSPALPAAPVGGDGLAHPSLPSPNADA